jgi:hypothetical protein
MADHQSLAMTTGMRIFFADPHSPWQRGSNENTNGLLRQYFPKGTSLSGFDQDDLDTVTDSLNGRPRKTLAYATPNEQFRTLLAELTSTIERPNGSVRPRNLNPPGKSGAQDSVRQAAVNSGVCGAAADHVPFHNQPTNLCVQPCQVGLRCRLRGFQFLPQKSTSCRPQPVVSSH